MPAYTFWLFLVLIEIERKEQELEQMSLATHIVICEPQILLRQGLGRLLDSRLFKVVAETSYLEEVIGLVQEQQPDIVILGQKSPQGDALELIAKIAEIMPDTRIVLLAESGTYTEIMQAKDAGVSGYLLKTFDAFAFNKALNIILTGEPVFPLDLESNAQARDKLAGLTGRERQILWHIAHGYSNKQVADELGISEGTVKVHVKSILKKLAIENRTQAAVYVHEKGVANYLGH